MPKPTKGIEQVSTPLELLLNLGPVGMYCKCNHCAGHRHHPAAPETGSCCLSNTSRVLHCIFDGCIISYFPEERNVPLIYHIELGEVDFQESHWILQ